MKIILASTSPQRQRLLKEQGISFEVMATNASEDVKQPLPPHEFVKVVSKRKADAAVLQFLEKCLEKSNENATIIAADTIVEINGKILGKPKDEKEAFEMIKLLQGKTHCVYTGLAIALINCGNTLFKQDVCCTKVTFKSLTDDEINEYVKTGESFDKSGSYAIQGIASKFVEKIDGDVNNVIGLPVELLKTLAF